MGAHTNDLKKTREDNKIEFKDLELLLQQCFDNRDLRVVNHIATRLLPAGENYGSIMVQIDAKIHKNKNSEEETLHMVGKTSSSPIEVWSRIFQKEIFMYAELFPLYRELEKEVGIDERDLINILPRFIGYRNSLKHNATVDDDSVLLMENLKMKGFYVLKKSTGIDFHHASKALTSLTRYHALGIVMQQKRSSFAEKAIEQARKSGLMFADANKAYATACKILINIPHLKKYASVIESSFENAKDGIAKASKVELIKPWATIIHGDFWTNNILFHRDDEGNVDGVKFVDFQAYRYNSPVNDVVFFLGCSLDVEAQTYHMEELLSLYYDVLVNTLRRMDCDVSLFSKESFNREVKRQAIAGLPMCALAHKFFIAETFDVNNSNEEVISKVINSEPSEAYINRLLRLGEVYQRMKWFDIE